MTEPQKNPPQLHVDSGWKMIVPLFLIPLAIVLGGVSVFYLFGKLAAYERTPQEYVSELLGSNSHKRWQSAFELSRYVIQKDKTTLEPEFESNLIKVYESSDPQEQKLRTYLTIVLAHVGKEDSAKLFGRVVAESNNNEDQIYALWALGKIASPSAANLVVSKLSSEDAGLRKTAAFALGFVGNKTHVPALEKLLKDDVKDVRWNAALALAELGSRSGAYEIENLLDKEFLIAQTPSLRQDEREEIVISAINASLKLKLKDAVPSITTWNQSNNSRLRNLSVQAVQELSAKL